MTGEQSVIAGPTASEQSEPERSWLRELVVIWLLISVAFTLQGWTVISTQEESNPDNLVRVHQVESLANGQGWYDLSIDRIGVDGVDMHWSRHVDVVAAPIYLLGEAVGDRDTARAATLWFVPLLFLALALWAVGGLARAASPHRTAPLMAMGLFCATAGKFHYQVGRIDHHGLHIALVLLALYFLVASRWRLASAAAGVVIGTTLTSSLETVPILAGVIGAVGLLWLFNQAMSRRDFVEFGLAIPAGLVISGVLLAPPGRLLSLEADTFSLPFLGLFTIPAVGLALVGGREWKRSHRLLCLAAIAGAAGAWVAATCLDCLKGPYSDLPQVLQDEWLARIDEITPLLARLGSDLTGTVSHSLFMVGALVALLVRARRRRGGTDVVLAIALAIAAVGAFWQIRGIPFAHAIAAPTMGGLVAGLHYRVISGSKARTFRRFGYVALAFAVLSGPYALLTASDDAPPSCSESVDTSLVPGRVVADMGFSSRLLLSTDHHMIASSYHRGDKGVLATYEMFTAQAEAARSQALALDADYIAICSGRSFVSIWGEDNPGSLADALSNGRVPSWLTPLTSEPATFYAVE